MQNVYLMVAGAMGLFVAVFHGVLMQRFMITPLVSSESGHGMPEAARRLIAPLLHLSTVSWFIGGVLLIAAPYWFEPSQRWVVSVLVGGLYLYGAVFNFIGTRGRHPGWILLLICVVLIGVDVFRIGQLSG